MASGFDDHLSAGRRPVELSGVALRKYFELLAVDRDEVLACGDGVGQVAQDGIVLEQVGQRGRAGQVIHRHKFDCRISERRAKNVAANTAKAVDANLYSHKV